MSFGGVLVQLFGLPFLYGQGTDRALTNTCPKSIAESVTYYLGLTIGQSYGAFSAGYNAVAAAIA
jgi:hypothetical protein